jgi:hypothetical protein
LNIYIHAPTRRRGKGENGEEEDNEYGASRHEEEEKGEERMKMEKDILMKTDVKMHRREGEEKGKR